MRAVVALVLLMACVGATASSFNTHDAEALEVETNDASDSELELADASEVEAELVDAAAVGAEDSVSLSDSEEDSDESEAEAEEEDASDSEDEAEADSESEAEAQTHTREALGMDVESGFAALDAAALARVKVDAFARVKKCTPETNLKCAKDGSVPFTKFAATPDYNGCGAAGASFLNDKTLGGTFSPCCNNHDMCYSRKGMVKDTCDTALYTCMKALCGSGLICKGKAWVFYQAVSEGGCGAWKASRLKAGCETGSPPPQNATTKATPAQTAAAGVYFPKWQ